MERTILVSAIYSCDLDDELHFTVNCVHNPFLEGDDIRGRWTVVLKPNAGKIYFLERVCMFIRTLDIEVAVFTDANYPGCIIIN